MSQSLQQNKGFVENVFNKVYDKYDLMNDIMSFGVHRIWKDKIIKMMNPSHNQSLIDVACGTGDIAQLLLNHLNLNCHVTCLDPNKNMIKKGKYKLNKFNNLNWIVSSAEKLPVSDNLFDFYTISFGLRNTKDLNKVLTEAFRVLKPGGRFLCLEFSKIQNQGLSFIFKNYSKIIPTIGRLVVGERKPYEYLIKSIENFVNQDELVDLMAKNNFKKCTYRNLSGGIVSIHSGWKI